MADLSVRYLGLDLRNPFVASSSEITGRLNGIRQCADAGAGAVVLESLFEEQINAELGGAAGAGGSAFPEEAEVYLRELGKKHAPDKYLNLIEDAKEAAGIPIIASVNSVSTRWWLEFARQIESAGADALELNIALMPISLNESSAEIERHTCSIVRDVRGRTNLPIAVKIGPYFTALPSLVQSLVEAGADSIVLFNRFYQLDIDPEGLKPLPGYQYSTPHELYMPLRWTSILAPHISCEFSLSTGVHSGLDAAKAIVAGARVVQIASVLYTKKIRYLATMIGELEQWLDAHGYSSVESARGALAASGNYRPEELERIQYIKALTRAS